MTWDDVWNALQIVFAGLDADVKAGTTGVASASGRTSAAAFPFGAYLSFGRDHDANREDVVISIDCKDDVDTLACTCDIARGGGYVLKDGPTLRVARSGLESAPHLARWVAQVSEFLRAQVGLVIDELCDPG